MTPWQDIGLIVGILASVVALVASLFSVGRNILVTEVTVKGLVEAMKEVKGKADGTHNEVTGPINAKSVMLAGQIANVDSKVDGLVVDFKAFVAEYRADQKPGRRS